MQWFERSGVLSSQVPRPTLAGLTRCYHVLIVLTKPSLWSSFVCLLTSFVKSSCVCSGLEKKEQNTAIHYSCQKNQPWSCTQCYSMQTGQNHNYAINWILCYQGKTRHNRIGNLSIVCVFVQIGLFNHGFWREGFRAQDLKMKLLDYLRGCKDQRILMKEFSRIFFVGQRHQS